MYSQYSHNPAYSGYAGNGKLCCRGRLEVSVIYGQVIWGMELLISNRSFHRKRGVHFRKITGEGTFFQV